MSAIGRRSGQSSRGFTLIELLVVVAIIALLISILLPSLSKARAQARTTLCASRIAQLAKAFLIYADDYGEAPPFTAYGRGKDPDDKLTWQALYDPSGNFQYDTENWMAGPAAQEFMWLGNEKDAGWPTNWARTGTLFTYTRFESLYRCPEFERIKNGECFQNVFNYSRSSLGRKATYSKSDFENSNSSGLTPFGFGFNGPILKTSQPYAPAQCPLVLDEDWRGYAGLHGDMDFSWCGCDPIMDVVDQFIGAYHGSKVQGVGYDGEWKLQYGRERGNVAMYDGHVELMRDWFPREDLGLGGRPNPVSVLFTMPQVLDAFLHMAGTFAYSQQGLGLDQVWELQP